MYNGIYFDNLQAGIVQGNIAEENHYYAYGLKIATLSSKKLGDNYEGTLKNNYLYNGKELFDDADLNWYDYGFRNYDPQIGRFTQLDPLTDSYPFLTPYQYASCDPITNIDVDGLEGFNAVQTLQEVIVIAVKSTPKVASVGAKIGSLAKLATIGALAIKAGNLLNNAFNSQPIGKNNAIVMNSKRYNHHSGQYLSFPGSSGNSGNSNRSDKSSKGLYGLNFTSEFSGGNNGRHGQTDEDPINADFIMAMTGSWMGEDIKFAKTWEEIIEKVPSRLKELNEMVETYEGLKQKRELEEYIKRAYQGENSLNTTTKKGKYIYEDRKKGDIIYLKFTNGGGLGKVTVTNDSMGQAYHGKKAPIDTITKNQF